MVPALLVVPVRDGLLADLRVVADLVEHAVRALREQGGVVVGRRTVEVDDVAPSCRRGSSARPSPCSSPTLRVVEGDVVLAPSRRGSAGRSRWSRRPVGLAFCSMAAPESVSRLTIASTVTPLVIICCRRSVAILSASFCGVLDVVLDAGLLERRLERRAVRGLPAGRGLGVGQDHADLALTVAATRVAVVVVASTGTDRHRRSQESCQHQAVRPLHAHRLHLHFFSCTRPAPGGGRKPIVVRNNI